MKLQGDKLQVQLDQHGQEFLQVGKEIDRVFKDIQSRLSGSDGKRIWRHFQRFAEYNDLKELYSKCVPEIARFEQKIIDFNLEIDKNYLIIRRFDENLATKVEKCTID